MHVARRTLLKTLPAGAVAPYLAPLVARAEAEAAGEKPMRFVFVLEGNGFWPQHVYPKGFKRKETKNPRGNGDFATMNGEDDLIDMPLGGSDYQLPDAVAPLERHIDRVTLLTGLSGRVAGGGHGAGYGTLGAYPAVAGPKDITVDCALGKSLPAIRPIVPLGFTFAPKLPMFTGLSAYGPNQKVSVVQDPALAHKLLFGKIVGGDPQGEVGSQSLVLDAIAAKISQVRHRMPGEEGGKLDRVADAFATIRQRQARLGDIDPARIPPLRPDLKDTSPETERMEAHAEMAVTALMTGLTNVVTLQSGCGYVTWKGLGIDVDTHEVGHRSGGGNAEGVAMRIKIRQFNAGLMAKLVDMLEAVPEGDGSMMDNTLIVYLSDSAETHHCLCMEWPMVLVGNLGGRLNLGGRFINVPRYGEKGHATVAQFYTSLLHAAGAPVDHFGMKDRFLVEVGLDQREPWTHVLA